MPRFLTSEYAAAHREQYAAGRVLYHCTRSGGFGDVAPPRDAYGNVLAPWKPLTRQAVVAGEAELEANSRARSVRMRVGERTDHPVES